MKFSMQIVINQADFGSDTNYKQPLWIKTIGPDYGKFYWQNGYGAFSIGFSGKIAAINYIKNQKEHHKNKTFQEEFLEFLNTYQVNYDERYLWD